MILDREESPMKPNAREYHPVCKRCLSSCQKYLGGVWLEPPYPGWKNEHEFCSRFEPRLGAVEKSKLKEEVRRASFEATVYVSGKYSQASIKIPTSVADRLDLTKGCEVRILVRKKENEASFNSRVQVNYVRKIYPQFSIKIPRWLNLSKREMVQVSVEKL